MNFTEFCDSLVSPLYEKEGELPKCPPGYKFDKNQMMCVPKSPKDKVGSGQREDKDLKPGNGAGYNVWGNSGYSGSGYAWEEPATSNDNALGGVNEETKPKKKKPTLTDRVKALEATKRKKQQTERDKKKEK